MITINLGKNPNRGGSPPRDNIKIGSMSVIAIQLFVDFLMWDRVFVFVKLNSRKIGKIKNEYRVKYIRDWILKAKERRASIHPMWVIEE